MGKEASFLKWCPSYLANRLLEEFSYRARDDGWYFFAASKRLLGYNNASCKNY
jgi:hypothetical protein|tara:strand:+ start:477 stop:635 length:159 start_codon:yes stop_codon:yes gene_type:complete